jgi:hypothetical protein
MPDMTVHVWRWCSTNEFWEIVVPGSGGKEHLVWYGETLQGPYQYGWSCTCPAFKYGSGKECKHIGKVKDQRCGYGWEAACGSPAGMGETCPKCGEPTSVVEVAV